jgi:hypothetical protein
MARSTSRNRRPRARTHTPHEPIRTRRLRKTALVALAERNIAKLLGVPVNSIRFVHPSGRFVAFNATIAGVRRAWSR